MQCNLVNQSTSRRLQLSAGEEIPLLPGVCCPKISFTTNHLLPCALVGLKTKRANALSPIDSGISCPQYNVDKIRPESSSVQNASHSVETSPVRTLSQSASPTMQLCSASPRVASADK